MGEIEEGVEEGGGRQLFSTFAEERQQRLESIFI